MSVKKAVAVIAACGALAASCSRPGDLPEPSVGPAISTLAEQPPVPTTNVEEGKPWAEPYSERHFINAGGLTRTYELHLPAGARERDRLPVVFAFHGYLEDIAKMRRSSQLDRADAIIAYLGGEGDAWAPAPYAKTTGEQDLAFVDAVLEQIGRDFSIDRARVFATGMSNGGGFAAYLGCQRPQEFTGVATVAAAFYERVSEGCSAIPMKHIDFHGTNDSIISYEGGQRHQSVYESTQAMLEESAERNHCAARAEEAELSPTVTQYTWQDCDAALVHYRIAGGKHVWPGAPEDTSGTTSSGFATRRQMEFFGITYE